MKFAIFTFLITLLIPTFAQDMGGGSAPIINQSGPCLTTEQREAIFLELAEKRNELIEKGILSANPPAKEDLVKFEWPLRQNSAFNDFGYHGVSNYVDHNAAFPDSLQDYNCGAKSYDTQSGYNHRGIDYFIWPFRWYKMDNDVVEVVSAAAGVIINKIDGNYDRNCNFNNSSWNAVYVQHADNSVAWYGHLKNGSLTTKNIGDSVSVGDFLGVVGSSGNSTGAHLHWEIYDASNNLIDPYAGPCNSMNNESWWVSQPDYIDSKVNAVLTQEAAPEFGICPAQEQFFPKTDFIAGEDIYLAIYYRDQLDTQTSTYTMYDPNGNVWQSWIHNSNAPQYNASYWWWRRVIPAGLDGVWTFEVLFEGESYAITFNVGITQSIENHSLPKHIAVYPNPADDELFIHSKEQNYTNAEFTLLDLMGKTVLRRELSYFGMNEKIQIPLTQLSSGIYILQAQLDGKNYSQKIMID